MQRPAVFIGSELDRTPGSWSDHPLAIPRVATVLRLCTALDWFEDGQFRSAPQATLQELGRFHRSDYIAALRSADALGVASVEVRERFGIGTRENPLFRGVFARASAAVGGSILAAQLALEGYVSFHPAGGTHHGRRARASGFCYFNDPVFALCVLLERGLRRVLYVDLDAHHGDGVQDAFRDDERVHTISIHEVGRWPFTGGAADRGGGRSSNYPVPAGFNDDELELLMQQAIVPLAQQLGPQAVVITCGTDALAGDPLSKLMLSNGALWNAVDALVALTPVAVILGGGGYNPWTLARCWTGLWGRLSGREIPVQLPPVARGILEGLSCDLVDEDAIDPVWSTTLIDAPRRGSVRSAVRDLAAAPTAERTPGVSMDYHCCPNCRDLSLRPAIFLR